MAMTPNGSSLSKHIKERYYFCTLNKFCSSCNEVLNCKALRVTLDVILDLIKLVLQQLGQPTAASEEKGREWVHGHAARSSDGYIAARSSDGYNAARSPNV